MKIVLKIVIKQEFANTFFFWLFLLLFIQFLEKYQKYRDIQNTYIDISIHQRISIISIWYQYINTTTTKNETIEWMQKGEW